jgi:hypothetical protein
VPTIHVPPPDLGGEDGAAREDGAVAAAEQPEAPAEEGAEPEQPEAGAEDGTDAATARKRTRRGSRGGRNRRKKPATATADPGTSEASDSS